MKFGLKNKELEAIVNKIKKVDKIEEAVIFGSRARGDYSRSSDIDIAVYAEDISDMELNLLRDSLEQLDIIYKIDLVDVKSLTKEGLIKNIEEEGVVIYSR
ncbi:nucleotidyltransferase domain-containing protein [Orenia marismortui]|uniref:nucleotidyltransferase domain-containing protein n=1 Tax=Orenia marismortui TaxID=46469 RepID=UPI000373E953|nr:nucleotidyltransferase domain-containing protein [Orenia marismortui]